MSSKYEVPAARAAEIRAMFKVKTAMPVRFARHKRIADVTPQDFEGAIQFDPGHTDPYAKDGCFEKQCLHRHGHPAIVGFKETAILEVNARGKKQITIYATDRKPAKFDAGEKPAGSIVFRPYPTSWLPDARRKFAQERAKRMAKGTYKPRAYKRTGNFANPNTPVRIQPF